MLQITVFVVASILHCGAADFVIASDDVDVKEIEVAGIKISDDKDRVKELLGDPLESGPTCDGCIDIMDSWFIYDEIRVQFLQSEVFQLEVTTIEYRLVSGVGVGTTREEVLGSMASLRLLGMKMASCWHTPSPGMAEGTQT